MLFYRASGFGPRKANESHPTAQVTGHTPLVNPMHATSIPVTTPSRSYSVTLAYGALDGLGGLLDDMRVPSRRFIVSSPLVWKLHGERVRRSIPHADPILVPDGERSKHLRTVSRVYDALVGAHADRAATL